jgi:hypothetical protein
MADVGMNGSGGIDAVLHTSVATLYSNLVTRPTGRAVRFAIDQQILETRGTCLSILDLSRVSVIDFSCADEVIARLLRKYRQPDRPANAFFVLQGVSDCHRETIETVLQRHGLLLVAMESNGPALWGPAPARLRVAWDCLGRMGRAFTDEFASARGLNARTAGSWLKRLVAWRVAVPDGKEGFSSLPSIFDRRSAYRVFPLDLRLARVADEAAIYSDDAATGDIGDPTSEIDPMLASPEPPDDLRAR